MAASKTEALGHTSGRARWCLAGMMTGFVAIFVISGAAASPLVTPLPRGARPPGWTRVLADALGLSGTGRTALSIASWLIVAVVVGLFVVLLREAKRGRVRTATAVAASLTSLVLATAAPMLLSRDVLSYAAYGRISAIYGSNPYLVLPASFARDPFVRVTSAQWLHTRSLYGPAFTLVSSWIVRTWPDSPGAVILAFKVIAGSAVGLAVLLTARSVRSIRPGRASLAVLLVGMNPVIVIHTVGGGHIDGLLTGMLAGGLALAIAASRAERGATRSLLAAAVTVVLTLACLTKISVVPILVLWIWWLCRAAIGDKGRRAALHLSIVAALSAALFTPFLSGWRTLTPVATLGGIETWASPAAMVANASRHLTDVIAGHGAGDVVHTAVGAAFIATAVLLLVRLGRAAPPGTSGPGEAAAFGWGPALLLLSLSLPFLLPWYAAWFVPFLALIADDVLMWMGVVASGVLALTLIPADPPHGYTSWEVMSLVHFAAAPIMLLLLVVVWRRTARMTAEPVLPSSAH